MLGLCGAYDPREVNDANFSTTYAMNIPEFSTFDSTNFVERWGGPWGGDFQRSFAESWKTIAVQRPDAVGVDVGVSVGSVFSADECPSGEWYQVCVYNIQCTLCSY